MLPPPPVLAPPVGAAVTASLDDTWGAGAVGATEELGTGTGGAVVGGVVVGGVVGGGVVGGGVDLHVQVGLWQWHVGLGVGVEQWSWQPPGDDEL
jgi:hypothetical protein